MLRDKRVGVKASQEAEVAAENEEGDGHAAEVGRGVESDPHDKHHCLVRDHEAWTAWILRTTATHPMVLHEEDGERRQLEKLLPRNLLRRSEAVEIAAKAHTLKERQHGARPALRNGETEYEAVEDHLLDGIGLMTDLLDRTVGRRHHLYKHPQCSESVA